jgi:2-keto-3-deoxy-L-rhamnonate aldolase RhmA
VKKNRLRELLRAGKPTWGTHLQIPWPRLWELIGHTGAFDYIEFHAENTSFTLEQFESYGRAIELFPNMSSMIKVEEHSRGFIATRAIDSGIQNVLFTDCRNADEVRECIRIVRAETPDAGGTHGANARRIMLGSNPKEWVEAMNDVVIAIMIEKKGAVDNLEEILSVKGVDMVQFGHGDYSISIGNLGTGSGGKGKEERPEIQKVGEYVIKMAQKHNIAVRVEVANLEQAKPYWEMGVRHFCMGWDTYTIRDWCLDKGKGIRELGYR